MNRKITRINESTGLKVPVRDFTVKAQDNNNVSLADQFEMSEDELRKLLMQEFNRRGPGSLEAFATGSSGFMLGVSKTLPKDMPFAVEQRYTPPEFDPTRHHVRGFPDSPKGRTGAEQRASQAERMREEQERLEQIALTDPAYVEFREAAVQLRDTTPALSSQRPNMDLSTIPGYVAFKAAVDKSKTNK